MPAPDFLFMPPVSYGPKIWKEETGPTRYRRAIYTFRYRSVPYPALQTFDQWLAENKSRIPIEPLKAAV